MPAQTPRDPVAPIHHLGVGCDSAFLQPKRIDKLGRAKKGEESAKNEPDGDRENAPGLCHLAQTEPKLCQVSRRFSLTETRTVPYPERDSSRLIANSLNFVQTFTQATTPNPISARMPATNQRLR